MRTKIVSYTLVILLFIALGIIYFLLQQQGVFTDILTPINQKQKLSNIDGDNIYACRRDSDCIVVSESCSRVCFYLRDNNDYTKASAPVSAVNKSRLSEYLSVQTDRRQCITGFTYEGYADGHAKCSFSADCKRGQCVIKRIEYLEGEQGSRSGLD